MWSQIAVYVFCYLCGVVQHLEPTLARADLQFRSFAVELLNIVLSKVPEALLVGSLHLAEWLCLAHGHQSGGHRSSCLREGRQPLILGDQYQHR